MGALFYSGCLLSPALIGLPELFIGGEESVAPLSPQPPVNNFAARDHRIGVDFPLFQCPSTTMLATTRQKANSYHLSLNGPKEAQHATKLV